MTYPFRQSYYHDYGPRKGSLGLDFHMAEGGDGTLDYLGDGGTPPSRGVSCNFLNLTDGTIYRMLDWDETAGTLNPADRATETGYYGPQYLTAVLGDHWPDPNVWSISMEICGFRAQGPTRAQVEAAVDWAADMKARFPTLRGAFGHHDQSPKGCPGTTPNMKEIFARIGGHGLWMEETMYDFTLPPAARSGSLVLKGDTHSYLRLSDGTLHGPVKATAFGRKRAVEIILSPPIPGGAAGADRASAYLIGDNAAAVLRSDATFTADDANVAVNAKLDEVVTLVNGVRP